MRFQYWFTRLIAGSAFPRLIAFGLTLALGIVWGNPTRDGIVWGN